MGLPVGKHLDLGVARDGRVRTRVQNGNAFQCLAIQTLPPQQGLCQVPAKEASSACDDHTGGVDGRHMVMEVCVVLLGLRSPGRGVGSTRWRMD